MLRTHRYRTFPYRRPEDLDAQQPRHYPVVVVGGGPCGLVAAGTLAHHGVPVLLLDDDDKASVGSRAMCWSKRTLEILDRLGCGQPMVDKGVTWNVGRVFFRDDQVYEFDLLPEEGHERPAFVNLQQYHFEEYLVEHLERVTGIEMRWRSRVRAVEHDGERVILVVETPDGEYRLSADYCVVADGANSSLRRHLGLETHGEAFSEHFLIADVVMHAELPTERWFWFEPPFHDGRSTLLHRQPDDVWRIDFGLGPDADPEAERQPEVVTARVRAMLDARLGREVSFDLEWCSVYTFRCERMESFRHGRFLFAGDAAHLVSPFGARGANGGIQDAENLAWKLAATLRRDAGPELLASYDAERIAAADENIRNSTRATRFIAPADGRSRSLRDATLSLAARYEFARPLVNSGRLTRPFLYDDSPVNSADDGDFTAAMRPGACAADAPVGHGEEEGWWLRRLGGGGFTVALFGDSSTAESVAAVRAAGFGDVVSVGGEKSVAGANRVTDPTDLLAERYDAGGGALYLFRPDQHVAFRSRGVDVPSLVAARRRALGHPPAAGSRKE